MCTELRGMFLKLSVAETDVQGCVLRGKHGICSMCLSKECVFVFFFVQ